MNSSILCLGNQSIFLCDPWRRYKCPQTLCAKWELSEVRAFSDKKHSLKHSTGLVGKTYLEVGKQRAKQKRITSRRNSHRTKALTTNRRIYCWGYSSSGKPQDKRHVDTRPSKTSSHMAKGFIFVVTPPKENLRKKGTWAPAPQRSPLTWQDDLFCGYSSPNKPQEKRHVGIRPSKTSTNMTKECILGVAPPSQTSVKKVRGHPPFKNLFSYD